MGNTLHMTNNDIAGKMEVTLSHIHDGRIITRNMNAVPRIGEWVSWNRDVYVVKRVIWNFTDARSVKILVEEPKD